MAELLNSGKNIIRELGHSVLHLVYPPTCLHCKSGLVNPSQLLCSDCTALLELIDPQERCPYCFSINFNAESKVCPECKLKRPILNGIASAFDYMGPAANLVRKLKYSDQTYLSEGCGAYMAAQFLRLDWPMPDVLIPVPISFTHWLERGYNQSQLLADSLSKLLSCPVQNALKRKSGDFSQAGLSRKQRNNLEGNTVKLKSDQKLQDKCILLIDDVMTTGSTINKCAEALLAEHPASIYGLTLCRTNE